MTSRTTCILLLAFVIVMTPSVVFASDQPLTPGDIIAREGIEDGDAVVFQGEAIGESLRSDGDHRWVNVLGGGSAIGVHMTTDMAEEIEYFGEYSTFGDTVEVRGVVNFACTQHDGEFDVHAEEIAIVEPGGPREHAVELWKLFVGAPLVLLGLGLSRLFVYLKNRGPA